MTEAELYQYRAIKDEIKLLESKIDEPDIHESTVVFDSVRGSTKGFPYIECNVNISGVDPKEYLKVEKSKDNLKAKRKAKVLELTEKETELHDFIYSIPDSQLRQIFILRFIDGLTQEEIGHKLHLERSTVSKKIAKMLCE